jgi:hypothetical protein
LLWKQWKITLVHWRTASGPHRHREGRWPIPDCALVTADIGTPSFRRV